MARVRKTYTEAQRRSILDAAIKEKLTALQVKKKFGVTPVTYYSWRKKMGAAAKRGGPAVAAVGGVDLNAHLRSEVRSKIRTMLPEIVRSEVASYLDSVFGAARGRRKR